MAKIVGVTLTERMLAGLIIDHKLVGPLHQPNHWQAARNGPGPASV